MVFSPALEMFPLPRSRRNESTAKPARVHRAQPEIPLSTFQDRTKPSVAAQSLVIQVTDAPDGPIVTLPPSAHIVDQRVRGGTPVSSRPGSPENINNNAEALGTESVQLHTERSSSPSQSPPMRSMFPTYNSNLPLSQQRYAPSQMDPARIPRQQTSRADYRSSLYSQSNTITSHTFTPHTAAAVSSSDSQEPMPEPTLSSQEDLLSLWAAANGQGVEDDGSSFTLKFKRDVKPKKPSLGSPPSNPNESLVFESAEGRAFYDLQTFSNPSSSCPDGESGSNLFSEVTIRRRHPHRNITVPICMLNLEHPSRRLPPNDGLVTLIYPKLAAMMALDSIDGRASAVSSPNPTSLSSNNSHRIASLALSKNAEKECCRLYWDADTNCYMLVHPTLNGGLPVAFPIDTINGDAGFNVAGTGTIRLLSPDRQLTLSSLDFGNHTLTVDTVALANIPSLYIVDVVVTAIFAVALVEGRRLCPSPLPLPATSIDSQSPSHPYPYPPSPPFSSLRDFTAPIPSPMMVEEPETKSSPFASASAHLTHFWSKVKHTASKAKPRSKSKSKQPEPMVLPGPGPVPKNDPFAEAKSELAGLPWPIRVIVRIVIWGFKLAFLLIRVAFNLLYAIVMTLSACVDKDSDTAHGR
ncbi:hypothetical protein L228DRAFT_250780 [Xylona heveae TC161]|uniref:Uncharacterized protein n=1 Tax=Xylona heveae (strain CBS 132557 / TC161) TaxID=1328760 RepID=A0A164ZYL8_XYLHT|nr:hypothetical protein L228DRAFT_250780 [Xylona heveae TC161]KZF19708.1 hypothetical protein L228DRAFT_250780 [Xylona heveae TC161]